MKESRDDCYNCRDGRTAHGTCSVCGGSGNNPDGDWETRETKRAVALLEKRGYTVTPPATPAKVKGEVKPVSR